MAAFALTYTVRDEDNRGSGSFTINLPTNLTIPQIGEFAIEMAPLLQAVMTGRIASVGVSIVFDLPPGSVNTTASPGSDLEEGAIFSFMTADNVPTTFRIPTFNENLMVSGTDNVDVTLPSVAAIITAIEDGLTVTSGATIEPVGPREEALTVIDSALESFKRYRY